MALTRGFAHRGLILRVKRSPAMGLLAGARVLLIACLLLLVSITVTLLIQWKLVSRTQTFTVPVRQHPIPQFAFAVRVSPRYGFGTYQLDRLVEMGARLADVGTASGFSWPVIEPDEDVWRWTPTDELFTAAESRRVRLIPTIVMPEQRPTWIKPDEASYVKEFAYYAGEVVRRYRDSPAWSGMVVLRADSSRVYYRDETLHNSIDPGRFVRFNNAAYEAIKGSDTHTVVVVPATMRGLDAQGAAWEDWHRELFARSLRFDWFGIDAQGPYTAQSDERHPHSNLLGLRRVRQFLDGNGHADKPIFQTGAGYSCPGNSPEEEGKQAQLIIQTLVSAMALQAEIRLRGWVYSNLLAEQPGVNDCGLLAGVPGSNGLLGKRKSWAALRTVLRSMFLCEYSDVKQIAGRPDRPEPQVFLFEHAPRNPTRVWAVFQPWLFDDSAKGAALPDQKVTIDISPARKAIATTIYGRSDAVLPEASGRLTVFATRSPLFFTTTETES